MREALDKSARIYMQSMFRRFSRFSMGDGNWAPLSQRTIDKKGHDAILIDSDTLRNSLDITGLRSAGTGGFKIGIPSGLDHPNSKLSVASLAKVHHFGLASSKNKNLPARPILVNPDPATRKRMNDAVVAGLREVAKRAKNG